MTSHSSFFAQVRRDDQWETIVHADKNSPQFLQPVRFPSEEKALQAGQNAWGPIQAVQERDYRTLPAP